MTANPLLISRFMLQFVASGLSSVAAPPAPADEDMEDPDNLVRLPTGSH